MRILGIDPGSLHTGYGVLQLSESGFTHCAHGVIQMQSSWTLGQRLCHLKRELLSVLDQHQPHYAAMEDLFFAKNAKSVLTLGQARGAILLTLAERELEVASYPPATVKHAVVGRGNGDKLQVQRALMTFMRIAQIEKVDASDALAVALCHALTLLPKMKLAGRNRRSNASNGSLP